MSSSTPTRKYSAGNGPRPGFHRQVNTLLDDHCDQNHGDHGGHGGHGDPGGQNGIVGHVGHVSYVGHVSHGGRGRHCGHSGHSGNVMVVVVVMVVMLVRTGQDRTGQDKRHLNLTFQVTCVRHLLQILLCFIQGMVWITRSTWEERGQLID